MVFLFSYRDVSTPTSSLSSFSLESPRSSFHESPSPCLSFNFDRRSPPTTEELSEFLQVFYICGQGHSFSLEIKTKILFTARNWPKNNKNLNLFSNIRRRPSVKRISPTWPCLTRSRGSSTRRPRSSRRPSGPTRAASRARPWERPGTEPAAPGLEARRRPTPSRTRRLRRPPSSRTTTAATSRWSSPHILGSAFSLVPQYLVIYNYLPAVASLNYFPVALFTFFLS